MVSLEELFARLSRGPLSNIAIGNNGSGTIIADKQPVLIDYINEGLLRLHTRFVLIEREVLIKLDESVTLYKLTGDYTFSANKPGHINYILDSIVVPFKDDVLKILSVWVSGADHPLPLNDSSNPGSVYTPQPLVLQVPVPVQDTILSILYQARYMTLPTQVIDLNTQIDLPINLEDALAEYVCYKVYQSMNGSEHAARATDHRKNFEDICNEAVLSDTVNSSTSETGQKFSDRGFV